MKNNKYTKEQLAICAITHYVTTGKPPLVNPSSFSLFLRKYAACFVTVYVRGALRGCIGTVVTREPLYRSIIRNAIEASSQDFRFIPITKNDLSDLSVEVSVLSPLRPYAFTTKENFLTYLYKEKPGLMLEKNGKTALFLPQVWKELLSPEDFLTQLSLKAGLGPNDWMENTNYRVFSVT
jgi:AmmeMemoRadiSam system protein A